LFDIECFFMRTEENLF